MLKVLIMLTIVLAGGSGTRLWPLSRENYPKQFIKVFDSISLFQMAIKRALLISQPEDIYIVTRDIYKFTVKNQIDEINTSLPSENILLEPSSKNTLPAIYYGVKTIVERGKNDVISVLPADHMVVGDRKYIELFEKAVDMTGDCIVVFGIKPRFPHTGYGYIKPGKRIKTGYVVDAFVEKPDLERARKYVKEGYLWNSGIFIFSPNLFFEEAKKYVPEIVSAFRMGNFYDIYKKIPSISMDYGVMEKTKRAGVIVFDGVWDDMGTFNSLYNFFQKDKNGNALVGDTLNIKSQNNIVYGEKLIVTLGIKDTLIIDTPDSLLVADRKMEQRVREVFALLKERGDKRVLESTTVYRPWGTYTILKEGENYKIKEIVVNPRKKISLQRHKYRSEHWVIVKGRARVTIGNKVFELSAGQSTYVPVGEVHRLENPYNDSLKIIEVQMGSYVGEDDIERLEDDYGRA